MPDYSGEVCRHVCPVCGGCDICCTGHYLEGVADVPKDVAEAFAEAMRVRSEAHRALEARRRAAGPHRGGHEHC